MTLANEPVIQSWPRDRQVDVALVVALDVSASVTDDEYDLMRTGTALAIQSQSVANALRSGPFGAIALSLMHWSGYQEQWVKADWAYITDPLGLLVFANNIRETERHYYGGATDIGGALEYCQKMLQRGPENANRLIIDLAGDGTNNVNLSPRIYRDLAAHIGITINALAISNKDPDLIAYYRETVIGGPAAFVEHTPNYQGFDAAMERKLEREISPLYS